MALVNVREDHLNGLAMGKTASVMRNGTDGATKASFTELRPLGVFATWQAERVIGDHDRNTLRLRLDRRERPAGFEPGATVWIKLDNKDLLASRNPRLRCDRLETDTSSELAHRRSDET